jgi:dihydroorotate dehydrogenase
MVEKLNKIRQEKKLSYEILGVGGVMTADDYFEYRNAGADAVQSATGAMWNPNLAHDIWKKTNA